MLVFPSIDLLGGNVVRLTQGRRDTAVVHSIDPVEVARTFAAAHAPRLHVVDLDAAFSGGAENNHAIIKEIVAASTMEVQVGGGIRTQADCQRLFGLGVRYAVIGTAAIKNPTLVERLCAELPGRIVVAVDGREGKVAVEAWTEDTAMSALDIGASVARAGAAAVLYTDVGRDGMRGGPNLDATARLARHIARCPVIASGGVAKLADLDELVGTGAYAVVLGKALHERTFSLAEAMARVNQAREP
jgi:phosphoribosylformimino-5-aminoimidazole carboxamide ribotide isomerase